MLAIVVANVTVCWSYDVRPLWPRRREPIEIDIGPRPCAVNNVKRYDDPLNDHEPEDVGVVAFVGSAAR